MNSERLFKILSYAAVFCGFFALWIAGLFGILGTGLFLAALITGWRLEGTKWQVSERLGTVLIVLALPLYYLLLRAGVFIIDGSDSALPGILARLIVTLSAIKILQRKSDRDWIFLYLMSFFEILLAAGISISLMYFASFVVYVFIMVCAIVLFEISKTKRAVDNARHVEKKDELSLPGRRIPATAVVLIIFIVALATPLFFLLPRVGGAGFGGSTGSGANTASGFSDRVVLGGIGTIQQNEDIVMRVRLEGEQPDAGGDIRWRGIALDTFDNKSWRKSRFGYPEKLAKTERDIIQVDTLRFGGKDLVQQTVYLEPINSPVLFALPRPVAVHGPMPFLSRDREGALTIPSRGERISYRVISETTVHDPALLRRDNGLYSNEYLRYLQLPDDVDPRIGVLASEVTANTRNRLDAAIAVEAYLQTQFGYTLDQKAGGEQPLADFLFNVREGHCEYFATAMAIMLRTQGIAARVVNGFQRGEYNDTANVFVVRQRNAHSWVEVYFPNENVWLTFDPTPFAGRNLTTGSPGIAKQVSNYLEALETFWIQYFVAYDNAEQRSLFTSVRRGIASYGKETSLFLDLAREHFFAWWREVRGDSGLTGSISAIGVAIGILAGIVVATLLFVALYRKIVKSTVWLKLKEKLFGKRGASIVEFYERMLAILASKGMVRFSHQTPLEFADAIAIPDVISITEKYHRVRFGERMLSDTERERIEQQLTELAEN